MKDKFRQRATDRRGFLKGVAATGTVLSGLTTRAARAASPNSKLQLAIVGCGGMGNKHLNWFARRADVGVVAICDVDRGHLEGVINRAPNALLAADFREVVGRDDVDAVLVATPDHWHALVSIAAARAGKHIYCEKPLANSIGEGRAVADAVKQAGVVLQTGSHERSNRGAKIAKQLVSEGRLGTIDRVEIRLPNSEAHLQEVENFTSPPANSDPPPALDYDFWLGHTPAIPFNSRRCHFWWRFHSEFGGGEMTDRGAHVIDLARYLLDLDDTGPHQVNATGKHPKGDFFDTYITFQFENVYRDGLVMVGNNREPRGLTLFGSEGSLDIAVHGCGLTAKPASLLDGFDLKPIDAYAAHRTNWLDSIRGEATPVASAEAGHRTSSVCHLNNLAIRAGQPFAWDPKQEKSTSVKINDQLIPSMRDPWSLV